VVALLLIAGITAVLLIPSFNAVTSAETTMFYAANLYVPAGSASTYLSNTVLQEAKSMGLTHILIWQYNYNEHTRSTSRNQLVDVCSRMRNYDLQPIISLEYDVDEAVALVTALGSNCMMYTVGKEPHVSGTSATASVNQYMGYWNQIVAACRQVNPNAMYGGPCVGSPTTSPESRSGQYVNAWLQQCDGDFLVVHSFPGGSTQSEAIRRASSYTVSDMQQLRQKLSQYGKPNMPIVFGEIQWTSAVTSNGWDYDQDFNDQWTHAFMSTAEEQGAYGACFWVLIGYDNNFAILRPPNRNYERKPQFYSIQSYIP
jgi:hypothetical protein